MREVWYFAADGRRVGPLSWDELKALAATGLVRATDPVWTVGGTEQPASAVPELFPPGRASALSGAAAGPPAGRPRGRWKTWVSVAGGGALLVAAGVAKQLTGPPPPANPPAQPAPAIPPLGRYKFKALLTRQAAERAQPHFDRGVGHMDRGEYPQAVEAFTEAIRAQPHHPEAFLSRGYARQLSGDPRGAVADLSEAVRLKPDYALAYATRAGAYAAVGENERAVADATEALRLDPAVPFAREHRGLAYLNLGRPGDAIRECEEALQRDPEAAAPHNTIGLAHHRRGEYARAVEAFDAALRKAPDDAEVRHNRGLSRLAAKEHAAARADFAGVRRLAPGHVMAHVMEAFVLACCPDAAVRDGPRAVELAARACELTSEKAFYPLVVLAAAHAECGRFDDAVRWAVRAEAVASEEQKPDVRKDLALYRAGKPVRDDR